MECYNDRVCCIEQSIRRGYGYDAALRSMPGRNTDGCREICSRQQKRQSEGENYGVESLKAGNEDWNPLK